MRQRLTRLFTGSIRTRRRAMRRLTAFCARVRARPRGFLVGMITSTWGRVQGQTAQILTPPAPCRQGIRGLIGHPLLVGATSVGAPANEDRAHRLDQQEVCDRLAPVLAAITARLLSWMLGTLDAPCGAIVANRGEAALDPAAAGSIAPGAMPPGPLLGPPRQPQPRLGA